MYDIMLALVIYPGFYVEKSIKITKINLTSYITKNALSISFFFINISWRNMFGVEQIKDV